MRTIKGSLFAILYLMLLLPLIQQTFHILPEKKLNGAVRNAPDTSLTCKGWLGDGYQQAKNDYLNDNMGLRSYLVRTNNEINFLLFRKAQAREVVVGRDGYLFEGRYIDLYCGCDYQGDSLTRVRLLKLKLLQDTLQKLGKCLLVLHAPSKAWQYPAYFPPGTKCDTAGPTRYKDYLRLEDSLHINSIDFNAWFLTLKAHSPYPLMSKQGTHWDVYGSFLAADSLIKRCEQILNIHMSHYVFSGVEISDTPRLTDNDIAAGMNLLFPPVKEKFVYPIGHFIEDGKVVKPNAIYIGDSFFWTFIYDGVPQHINNDYLFWYSWGELWYRKGGENGHSNFDEHDWISELNNTDMVIFISSEVNLDRLGNGFIEKAYDHYYPKQSAL